MPIPPPSQPAFPEGRVHASDPALTVRAPRPFTPVTMRRTLVVSALLLALGPGCRTPERSSDSKPTPASTKGGGLATQTAPASGSPIDGSPMAPVLLPPSGRIHAVRADLRFVVLDYTLGGLPAEGAILSVYRQNQKVGELRLSGPPERSGFVTADILEGFIQVDDEVRMQ